MAERHTIVLTSEWKWIFPFSVNVKNDLSFNSLWQVQPIHTRLIQTNLVSAHTEKTIVSSFNFISFLHFAFCACAWYILINIHFGMIAHNFVPNLNLLKTEWYGMGRWVVGGFFFIGSLKRTEFLHRWTFREKNAQDFRYVELVFVKWNDFFLDVGCQLIERLG